MAFNALVDMTAYADRLIKSQLLSQLHEFSPTLSYLASKGGNMGELGKPGVFVQMGGRAGLSSSRIQSLKGSSEFITRFQTATLGGTKNLTETDTTASLGNNAQNRVVRGSSFRWAFKQTPIRIDKMVVRTSGGKFKIANVFEEAVQMAIEEHLDSLGTEIITGNPADQAANIWSACLGIIQAGHTTNTYGNVDRSATSGFVGRRVTTAKNATLSLIDNANLSQTFGKVDPVDLAVTTPANYLTMKNEALARGASAFLSGNVLPEKSKVGQKMEGIVYGNTTIIPDPKMTANYVFMTRTKDWVFNVHGDNNVRVTEFVDGEKLAAGSDDAYTAHINTMYTQYTNKPINSITYTNVT